MDDTDSHTRIGYQVRLESPKGEITTFTVRYLSEAECGRGSFCSHCSGWEIDPDPEVETEHRREVDRGEARDYTVPDGCYCGIEADQIYDILISRGYYPPKVIYDSDEEK